jgi:ligand-binding SRPBCC domain-containing protein
MIIEDSIIINAPLDRVWNTFTDLTCWKDWSSVLGDVTAETKTLTEGKRFKFCLRPFNLPLNVAPIVEEVIQHERIVWSGSKHGVHARHEFSFQETDTGILLQSIETFSGNILKVFGFAFPVQKMKDLTILMLNEVKEASENHYIRPKEGRERIWKKKEN